MSDVALDDGTSRDEGYSRGGLPVLRKILAALLSYSVGCVVLVIMLSFTIATSEEGLDNPLTIPLSIAFSSIVFCGIFFVWVFLFVFPLYLFYLPPKSGWKGFVLGGFLGFFSMVLLGCIMDGFQLDSSKFIAGLFAVVPAGAFMAMLSLLTAWGVKRHELVLRRNRGV